MFAIDLQLNSHISNNFCTDTGRVHETDEAGTNSEFLQQFGTFPGRRLSSSEPGDTLPQTDCFLSLMSGVSQPHPDTGTGEVCSTLSRLKTYSGRYEKPKDNR